MDDSTAFERALGGGRRRKRKQTKLRPTVMPNSMSEDLLTTMDDPTIFCPPTTPRNEVVLGVYGSEDWVFADAVRKRYVDGKVTIQYDVTWLVPGTFSLHAWARENVPVYTFFAANRVLAVEADCLVKVTSGRGKIEVEFVGHPDAVDRWMAHFDGKFRRAQSLIEWVYNQRGDEISVPLNFRPAITSAYPWLKKPINDYIDDYLNSPASVLILIGQPGTGKTTFIKNLIHRSGGNAKVAYDERVMGGDDLFANFIDDDSRFLIMEDADAFLQSRTDGNTMMHKFLNVSDGLISAADKKLVFSTNLPKIADIDSALMRPGRCFDVLEFRPLTRDEATAVIEETGKGEIPGGAATYITLAEIFSQQPSEGTRRKRGIGF